MVTSIIDILSPLSNFNSLFVFEQKQNFKVMQVWVINKNKNIDDVLRIKNFNITPCKYFRSEILSLPYIEPKLLYIDTKL